MGHGAAPNHLAISPEAVPAIVPSTKYTTPQAYVLKGEMVYADHHIERAPDRNGAERDAIVFELRSLEAIAETKKWLDHHLGLR